MAIDLSEAFSVEGFRAALQNGGARSNQFRVQLNFPAFVSSGFYAADAAQFLVTAASLPGSTVNQTMLYYRGREVKLAGERVFQPWSITVINDTGFTMRNAFDEWMNGINNLADNSGLLVPSDYQSDFTVTQLDRNSMPLKAYSLQSAFPVDVTDVPLDFGANDQISSFNVTFAYQTYTTQWDGSGDDGSTPPVAQFSQSVNQTS